MKQEEISMVFKIDELPLTLRVEEIAKIMRISKANAYELTRRPDFPCVKVGRRICIPRDAFLKWYGLID
jgi:excisionase family DNA binding protein